MNQEEILLPHRPRKLNCLSHDPVLRGKARSKQNIMWKNLPGTSSEFCFYLAAFKYNRLVKENPEPYSVTKEKFPAFLLRIVRRRTIFFILTAVICVLVVGLFLFSQTEQSRQYAKNLIEQRLNSIPNFHISLGNVEGSIISTVEIKRY